MRCSGKGGQDSLARNEGFVTRLRGVSKVEGCGGGPFFLR